MKKDLFTPVVPEERMHHLFRAIREGAGYEAGRRMMSAVFSDFQDVDHSFVREFQTGGFSARVFELALFAHLAELDAEVDRSEAAPDFVVRGSYPVAIEVTTANPPQGTLPTPPEEYSPVPDNLPAADKAFILQIGKAIRKKLQHRDAAGRAYWEKPHVAEVPFVIAVGAFHDEHAQWHPMGLVSEYLYGQKSIVATDDAGNRTISFQSIAEHESGGRRIPSGLFRHPEAASLAGVLFSNAHTAAMFNRIGAERGFAAPNVAMVRAGMCYDPRPDAVGGQLFSYVVGDRPPEDPEMFGEGLHLFLNPWASRQLSPAALPATNYTMMEDGVVVSYHSGGLQPFISQTSIYEGPEVATFARYRQLEFLGLVPPMGDVVAEANSD